MPTRLPKTRAALWRWRWAGLALLIPLAAIAIGEALGWPLLRQPLERRLSASLARSVSFGNDFSLRFLPAVRLRTDMLAVGSPATVPIAREPGGSALPFLRAQRIDLVIPHSTLHALLRPRAGRHLIVRSLAVDQFDLNLLRGADGSANWALDTQRKADAAPPRLPTLERVALREGRLRLVDGLRQIDVQASARMQQEAASQGGGTGRLDVSASGSYRGQPLKASARSNGWVPFAALRPDAGVPFALDLQVGDTRLVLDGRVNDLLHLAGLDARFDLAGRSLASVGETLDVTLPTTPAFTMAGRVRNEGRRWDASVARLHVGSSRLHGEFRYEAREPRAHLGGTLGGARLALVDLAPAFGAPPEPRADRDGRVLPQRRLNVSALRKMDASVAVKLDSADFGTSRLQAFAPLHGRVELRDGVLSITDLVARTASGELRGGLAIDSRPAPPRWHGDLRLSGVDLERFIRVRNPQSKSERGYISGQLSGRAKVQGQGQSMAAVMASLNGSIDAWVSRGSVSHLLLEMSGIDIAESLGLMLTGDDQLALRCAVTRLDVRQGVMTPEVAVIDTNDTTLLVAGRMSLADERLALVLTAHPKDFSPLALRTPIKVEGSFSAPQVKLDKRAIGLRAAAAAALAVVAPLASALALVDLGEPEKADCGSALARARGSGAGSKAPAPAAKPSR
jgi:uncharacterized protein involved in outer membrane biogenesis